VNEIAIRAPRFLRQLSQRVLPGLRWVGRLRAAVSNTAGDLFQVPVRALLTGQSPSRLLRRRMRPQFRRLGGMARQGPPPRPIVLAHGTA
jgi:hypothetical protein